MPGLGSPATALIAAMRLRRSTKPGAASGEGMNIGRVARWRCTSTWQAKGSISAKAAGRQQSGSQATEAASMPLQTLR